MVLSANNRNCLKDFLMGEPCVNTVVKVSGEHEFLIEALFEGMLGMDEFMEKLSALPGVQKRVWHVVEEMKKEEFLPQHLIMESSVNGCKNQVEYPKRGHLLRIQSSAKPKEHR